MSRRKSASQFVAVGGEPRYDDVRDLTEIVWTRKEPVNKGEPGKSGQAASQAAIIPRPSAPASGAAMHAVPGAPALG
jgi:hypothetical protein